MIFITLGSQKFQFNRLLRAVDQLANDGLEENIFAQIGYSDYEPQNYKFKHFLDREEFSAVMGEADIVITHGGTGAIMNALKKGKKVIAVPRLARYGEHVDDHQLQIINQFEELDLICECKEIEKMGECIEKVRITKYKTYESNTVRIISSLKEYIDAL